MEKFKKVISKDPSNLISSVLFLLIGIILFTNPNGIIEIISYIVGSIIIIAGIIKILTAKKTPENKDLSLTIGILAIIIGIILIFCSSVIEFMLRIFMGGWILLSGINKLILALNIKNETKNWNILLIVSIILMIIGLYVILVSNLVFSTIGLIMIIYSLIALVGVIFTPRKKNEDIIK